MTVNPWEVLERYLSNGEPTWTEVDAALAALTTLREQAERQEAALQKHHSGLRSDDPDAMCGICLVVLSTGEPSE